MYGILASKIILCYNFNGSIYPANIKLLSFGNKIKFSKYFMFTTKWRYFSFIRHL